MSSADVLCLVLWPVACVSVVESLLFFGSTDLIDTFGPEFLLRHLSKFKAIHARWLLPSWWCLNRSMRINDHFCNMRRHLKYISHEHQDVYKSDENICCKQAIVSFMHSCRDLSVFGCCGQTCAYAQQAWSSVTDQIKYSGERPWNESVILCFSFTQSIRASPAVCPKPRHTGDWGNFTPSVYPQTYT